MRLVRRWHRVAVKAPTFRELTPAELKAVVGGCGCPNINCITSKLTACV